jgi:hypothetical protein
MERTEVVAGDVAAIGYEPLDEILEIEFNNLCVFNFFEVPNNIHEEFITSEDHDHYFESFIENQYDSDRVL